MKTLERKLLRDLLRLWSQALTIALVVASGSAAYLTSLSAVDSLELARAHFYSEGRFADLFASLKRAPDALAERLRQVPGVADVQTTVEHTVRVTLPGLPDPIIGQLIGIDPDAAQRMNLVSLAAGRMPTARPSGADNAIESLVSKGFAEAHGLLPGSRVNALVNGMRRSLLITGIGLSPEFIFAGLWGMPDARGFGVFWVEHDALAAAYNMDGAFNRAVFKLAPFAQEQAVIDAVRRLLAPYGGREVLARAEQTSHAMLDNEIAQQRVMGTVLPAIFLGVAAFLLNVVVARLVSTQREQIATLKALGYANRTIGLHYLQMVLLIVLLGLLIGALIGKQLGVMLTGLYAELFHFPRFEHRLSPALLLTNAAVTILTAMLGTVHAIASTVRLPPAVAMHPPAPPKFRRTLLETLGIESMGPALRMIVRNMERRPVRTVLSVGGVAAALAIVILGNFFRDAIEMVIDTQFTLGLRADISLWTTDPVDDALRLELARLPGVKQVESSRFVPVTLINGHLRERTILRGYHGRAELYRVIDTRQREFLLDAMGLVLTDRLADKLALQVGQPVRIEVHEGRARMITQVLRATVPEMFGLNAYMERGALNEALGDGDLSTGFVLALEPGSEARVLEATTALPRIAGAWSKDTMLRNMQEISARNVRIMSTIMTVFASVIAVAVVYNNARIALSERAWELASLRVLGFTRAEVSALLLGEMAIVIALALPAGMLLGSALVHLIAELLKSDQFHFPVVIWPRTYAFAALSVLGAALASALVVRRRIDRLDLVAVLKTRE